VSRDSINRVSNSVYDTEFAHAVKTIFVGLLLLTCSMPFSSAIAETQLPEFKKLRFEEDYSDVYTTDQEDDFFYRLKYIPISETRKSYVSIGGEARWRYEYTHNPDFDGATQDKRGVLLQRYMIHSDVHFDKNTRLFIQFSSALEAGRKTGPTSVDENKLAVQNLFVDYSSDIDAAHKVTFRGGRQEINLGSGRLVDVREGPNVRRTFDGVRVMLQDSNWNNSVLILRPRLNHPGIFDDQADREKALWGVYATNSSAHRNLDFYYLGFKDDSSSYEQGTNSERRHSFGSRLSGQAESWDYNWEFVYQWGTFGSGDIRAWTLATETGYQWRAIDWTPHLGLSVNVASGDKNPDDRDLESFNALYPRGNYFSQAAVLGPRNFYNLHPSLSVNPVNNWMFTIDVNYFWRLETRDGVYGPSGQLIRSSSGSNERFVGAATSLNLAWSINENLTMAAVYVHWIPGKFMTDTGASEPIDFIELTAQLKF